MLSHEREVITLKTANSCFAPLRVDSIPISEEAWKWRYFAPFKIPFGHIQNSNQDDILWGDKD